MRITRWISAVVGAGAFCAGVALAQQYPERPVTMVVPFPPGGVAADHLDVRPAQPELRGEQAGQGVVGATALGSGGHLDLQGVAVRADDPRPGRSRLDVHGEQHVAVVVDPEGGHAAG